MRTELDVLNRNINVPGCVFLRTGLRFDKVDEQSLVSAGACLQEMANCGDWWWGDYLVAWADFRLKAENDAKHLAAMDETDQERQRRHFVRNHASVANGRELVETQMERYKVAKFYTAGTRVAELSNEHHRLAMDGSEGDLAVAQGWLEKARDRGWSRNELRAEMRAAKRGTLTTDPVHVTVTQQELFAAKRWARAQIARVPDMQQQEMEALLADLAPLLQLANEIGQRLAARQAVPGLTGPSRAP
jgi:hypothetical protein